MMRRAYDQSFIKDDDKIIGINLGFDFCAEHEWGIKDIKDVLGIPKDGTLNKKFGVKGRTITKFPRELFFFDEGPSHSCLTFEPHSFDCPLGWKNRALLDTLPDDIATAWSSKEFGIVVVKQHSMFLRELFEAFERKDVAIWLAKNSNPFSNAGLTLVIASKISKEINDAIRQQDESRYKLKEAVKKTGIRKILKKANKKYLALSPRWADTSETKIIFWLNPRDQKNNNFGWFTLQDLIDWTKDTGPIPKK